MKTRLSVNLNKVALIRNARGGNLPNLVQVAKDCEAFGAEGITVHPRPDQRHIRYDDLEPLKEVVSTEFNIEGYPSPDFMKWMEKVRPHQCTLVPDPPGVLTSSEGWRSADQISFLMDVVSHLKSLDIRVSLFMDAVPEWIEAVARTGPDRIELYTGDYAHRYHSDDKDLEIKKHIEAASFADEIGLGVNAGHDLNLDNLAEYKLHVPNLLEVSIGHALISDALYFGLKNTILMYRRQLS